MSRMPCRRKRSGFFLLFLFWLLKNSYCPTVAGCLFICSPTNHTLETHNSNITKAQEKKNKHMCGSEDCRCGASDVACPASDAQQLKQLTAAVAALTGQLSKHQNDFGLMQQLLLSQQKQVQLLQNMVLADKPAPAAAASGVKFGERPRSFPCITDFVKNSPLVRLQRMCAAGGSTNKNNNVVLVKLEGSLPSSSVKARPALNMILEAEKRGEIHPGRTTIVEATSGNTGIGLSFVAAARGYKCIIIMPDNSTKERIDGCAAYGAEVLLVSNAEWSGGKGMERARDLAAEMKRKNPDAVWTPNQFDNFDNARAHEEHTAHEIWRDTNGSVTHIVSAMGTTGSIMGLARGLRAKAAAVEGKQVRIIGCEPASDAEAIPGIRKWSGAYVPKIFKRDEIDEIVPIKQADAEQCARLLARTEGIAVGPSSGGAIFAAMALAERDDINNAVIVVMAADLLDRYLSSSMFPKAKAELQK